MGGMVHACVAMMPDYSWPRKRGLCHPPVYDSPYLVLVYDSPHLVPVDDSLLRKHPGQSTGREPGDKQGRLGFGVFRRLAPAVRICAGGRVSPLCAGL